MYVNTPLQVCEQRDPKGLYGMAKAGKLAHFTGISDPYEVPEEADLVIDTSLVSVEDAIEVIIGATAKLTTPASPKSIATGVPTERPYTNDKS